VVAGPQGLTSSFVLESCGYWPGLDHPERVGELKLSKDEGFFNEGSLVRETGTGAGVLVVGEMPDPRPGPGEVRIRIAASGITPGDIRKRQDSFGVGMP
jgi:hypothetical protein